MKYKSNFNFSILVFLLTFLNLNLFSQLTENKKYPSAFQYLTGIRDFRQIATQEQIDQYGTIYDFRVLSDGTYLALYGNSPDNIAKIGNSKLAYTKPGFLKRCDQNLNLAIDYLLNNEASTNSNFEPDNISLYKLDSNFKIIWCKILYNYSGDFKKLCLAWDIDLENNLFAITSQAHPSGNYDIKLVDLKNGDYKSENLANTLQTFGLFIKILDAKHIFWGYPQRTNNFNIRIYYISDFSYVENPPYLQPLIKDLSVSYKAIDSFFIDPVNNWWILQVLEISNQESDILQDWIPTTMQTLIYDWTNEIFVKTFVSEEFVNLDNTNIRFSDDYQSLISLSNMISYKNYLKNGENVLLCKSYSLVKNTIIPITLESKFWSLSNSGESFLLKDNGLWQAQINPEIDL